MHRWARALPSALVLLALAAPAALAAGPPFPDPVPDQAVYDEADILEPATEAELERIIDAIEARSGAEVVVYAQDAPDISEQQNLENARALVDQWGIGRAGFDDSAVLMVAMDPDPGESRVSLFGGSGFLGGYANEATLQQIIDEDFVPLARGGDLDGATLAAIRALDEHVTPGGRERFEQARILNAALGLIGAPIALLATLGLAWNTWRREGDDPDLTDSPSILMAGPPADMTPALATVIRQGTGTQHSINTILADLASAGRLSFHNLDQVRGMRSDDDPDPLTDPAIEVHAAAADDGDRLPPPEREAWDKVVTLSGGGGRLSRERLWRLNSALDPVKGALEYRAVKLGWLARMPRESIGRMTWIGVGIAVIGAGIVFGGIVIPMSGAVLLGGALVLGGIGTIGFGRAMSQRTPNGAYVDAMLKAYRRTLQKTMEQARSMEQVVEEPEVARLAPTPDRAVVWGLALGLHDEVASVLARGLEEQREATGSPAGAYYP
ncbi:MAG: TPM domain-containing protein, partial [Chloroflexota bacterium]|nr:TPM domain-containing protein [Chloroflexota bacterium]